MSSLHAAGDEAADMAAFAAIFFDEAQEHLESLESLLVALDPVHASDDDLNAIFRAAHSVKGGAGTFGFNDMAEVTHELESLLDRARRRELVLTPPMVDALLAARDVLLNQLGRHRGEDLEPADAAGTCARIRAFLTGSIAAAAMAPEKAPRPVVAPQVMRRFEVLYPDPEDADKRAFLEEALKELGCTGEPCTMEHEAPAVRCAVIATTIDPVEIREALEFLVDPARLTLIEAPEAAAAADAGEIEGFGMFSDDAPEVAVVDTGIDGFGMFEADAAAEGHPGRCDSVDSHPGRCDSVDSHPGRCDSSDGPGPNPAAKPTVAALAAAPVAGTRERGAAENLSIRVGVEKVDVLINLVGELVITQAMLAQKAAKIAGKHPQLMAGMTELERNTRDLQEAVMSIRMLPIAMVFNRFPRMLRELAARLGKDLELQLVGESTELDRGVIEKLADPMTHLVRNAVDHGIETPADRLAAGKPAHGTLTLAARHQGGHIVIDVADDGRGLDRAKLIAKARERGIAIADDATDTQVFNLIFEPGFSTAKEVTDVSGRGVGMDVVRRNIVALGGTVEIDSALGRGTRITVRLPLTLAIMDGMCVSVAGAAHIIPLASVVELIRPGAKDIRTVSGQGRVVDVRDEFLPAVDLAAALGARRDDSKKPVLVIVDVEGVKAALFVDELLGQQQVVVKSLEDNYKRVPGISGATILGDGTVALIVDVASAVRIARHGNSQTEPETAA